MYEDQKAIHKKYIDLMYEETNKYLAEISPGSDPYARQKKEYYQNEVKIRSQTDVPLFESIIECELYVKHLYFIPKWRVPSSLELIDIFKEGDDPMISALTKKNITWTLPQENLILATYKNKFIEYIIYYNYNDPKKRSKNIPFSLIQKQNDNSELIGGANTLEELKEIAQVYFNNFMIEFMEEME